MALLPGTTRKNKQHAWQNKLKAHSFLGKGIGILLEELNFHHNEPHFDQINTVLNNEANILITDKNGVILYVNDKCSEMVGYAPEELIGQHTRIFKTGYHSNKFYQELWKTLLLGKVWKGELQTKRKDGSTVWSFISIFPLLDEKKQPHQFLTIRTDITELKGTVSRQEKQLMFVKEEIKTIAYFDFLTGLPNRRHFENLIYKKIDYAKDSNITFALMLLDIDGFKHVNSSFGHRAGDELLQEVAARITGHFEQNTFFGRLGGDEFGLLLPEIDDIDVINKKATDLISLLSKEPLCIQGNELFITASIGISTYPYSGESAEDLLKHADMAMYQAKKAGKNQYQIFSPTMNLNSFKQFMLKNDSKKAFINNEYSVYFQPRVHPLTNDIKAAEALIRWNHPRWGVISTDEFLPIVEESGLLDRISGWMIQNVCRNLKKWEEQKLSVKKVSINVSLLKLLTPNFVDQVSEALRESSIDPKWIEFEITERTLIDQEDQVLKTLSQLKELGISLALDGFGAGSSSINFLRKFPCDLLKIDKSLIKDLESNVVHFEIVNAIINLCHRLGKKVAAEGVETAGQLSLLKELGCDEVQGFFFSMPVDEQHFIHFLEKGKWVQEQETVEDHPINKRKYFRVSLQYPLSAEMTIDRIGLKKLNLGSSEILIEDIGPGGLRFLSAIRLPIKKDFILKFTTQLFSGILEMNGHVVWMKETEDGIYEYGVKFVIDECFREKLIKILNQLQVKLKDKSIIANCRFVLEEKKLYIKKYLRKK